MTSEQKDSGKVNRGRSLSRQILGNDLDLVNKYASKYNSKPKGAGLKRTQTYSAVPNPYASYGAYGGYGGGGGGNGYNYSHGYGSGSGSSTGSGYGSARRKPRRQPSNLINASTLTQWDQNAMNSQEQDMSAAMSAMVSSYQNRLNDEATFLDEIQDEAEDNEDFAKEERADEWTVKEVCFWLNKIHLDKYIKGFRDQIIDGSILLRDLDESMLLNELGIKKLHVKKLIREITKLKNKATKLKKENNDTRDELIQSLRTEVEELKAKNKSLQQELQQLKLKTKSSSGNLFGGGYNGNGNGNHNNYNYK